MWPTESVRDLRDTAVMKCVWPCNAGHTTFAAIHVLRHGYSNAGPQFDPARKNTLTSVTYTECAKQFLG